jgi:hypothetical protein
VHGNVTAAISIKLALQLKPAQSPTVVGVEIQPNSGLLNGLLVLDHVQFPTIFIAPKAIMPGFSSSVQYIYILFTFTKIKSSLTGHLLLHLSVG